MATILNTYSISGGDTTSSTFTSNGDCVKVEATTTNINGNNAFIQIQSSDDQTTWKDIGQIKLLPGSDTYCSDPSTITGLYVRAKLICNDANNGVITITAIQESGTTAHSEYTPTFNAQLGTAGFVNVLAPFLTIQVDGASITSTGIVQIALDGAETEGHWTFDLPIQPDDNFASDWDLVVVCGYPINQAVNPAWYIKWVAVNGEKKGKIDFGSDTPGDSVIFSIILRYHL